MTANNRSSRRQIRVPTWFSDHVMEKVSQKRNDNEVQEVTEEIRANKDGIMDEIGENGVEADKEVFGNEVKDHDNGREEVEVKNKGLDDKSNEYDVEEECTVNDETESPVKTNNENAKSSYVNAALNACLDNTLTLIPTEIGTDGIEVVIFDDEIVKEGSKKWELTSVIENGPWMVNRKPMFVQKWDPTVCLDRAEPNKLPLWVKLRSLPLEA
ncbi:RNA-directed DNA polymerase, eukaryota, reverse transcriptase zinc-binding domain protein [Tanacetum coccineum]